jgi:hypothetical protein
MENTTKTATGTGEFYRIHIPKHLIRRVFALSEKSKTLTPTQILNAAIVIGLKRLEGGDE